MSFFEIGRIAFGTKDQLLDWFKSSQLISSRKTCTACNVPMLCQERSDISDGHR